MFHPIFNPWKPPMFGLRWCPIRVHPPWWHRIHHPSAMAVFFAVNEAVATTSEKESGWATWNLWLQLIWTSLVGHLWLLFDGSTWKRCHIVEASGPENLLASQWGAHGWIPKTFSKPKQTTVTTFCNTIKSIVLFPAIFVSFCKNNKVDCLVPPQ